MVKPWDMAHCAIKKLALLALLTCYQTDLPFTAHCAYWALPHTSPPFRGHNLNPTYWMGWVLLAQGSTLGHGASRHQCFARRFKPRDLVIFPLPHIAPTGRRAFNTRMAGFRGPVGAQHATPSPQSGVDVIFPLPHIAPTEPSAFRTHGRRALSARPP